MTIKQIDVTWIQVLWDHISDFFTKTALFWGLTPVWGAVALVVFAIILRGGRRR